MKKLSDILPQDTIQIVPGWQKRGYVSITNKVLFNHKISLGAKVIYWYLLTRCFNKNSCFPSNQTMGKDLGIKRPETIIKYKRELVEEKLLKVIRRGNKKSNVYLVKF